MYLMIPDRNTLFPRSEIFAFAQTLAARLKYAQNVWEDLEICETSTLVDEKTSRCHVSDDN